MRDFRMSKGTKEHYTSLEDLRAAWGCKPLTKQTSDNDKLMAQRKKFKERHLCKACKQPMDYVGGNTMVCTNESCKGIKHESVNEETNEKRVWYSPSYDLLDDHGAEIAENIFA